MLPGRTRPALSTLEEMEQEAASLPAAVPETEGLIALINKADEWKAKSAALAAQKAPLKKMREVLHMGLRMPVEVPQLEALRAEIRRREWEDTAKKVCSIVESIGRFTRLCMQRPETLLLFAVGFSSCEADLGRPLLVLTCKFERHSAVFSSIIVTSFLQPCCCENVRGSCCAFSMLSSMSSGCSLGGQVAMSDIGMTSCQCL